MTRRFAQRAASLDSMQLLYTAQNVAMLALSVVIFVAALFCFIHALRVPAEAFSAAGKLTRTWWLVITGLSALVAFIGIGPGRGFGMLGIVAVIAAGVYLADVRPALNSITPAIRKRRGASGHGPHGSW